MVGRARIPEVEDTAVAVTVLATNVGAARRDDDRRGRRGSGVIKKELARAIGASNAAIDRPLREDASRGAINKGDHIVGLVWVAELARGRDAEGLEDAGVVHHTRPDHCWVEVIGKVDRVSTRARGEGKGSQVREQAPRRTRKRRDIRDSESRSIGDRVGDGGGSPVRRETPGDRRWSG